MLKFTSASFGLAFASLLCACSSEDDPADGPSVGGSSAAGAAGNGGSSSNAGSAGAGGSGGVSANGGSGNEGVAGTSFMGNGGDANSGSGGSAPGDAGVAADAGGGNTNADGTMTFFVTSNGMGDGGNLGGLAGADAFCRQLATAASANFARRQWRAYLSTTQVNARDRIGTGPWHNQAGALIANDLTQLHDQGMMGTLNALWPIGSLTVPLDEQGGQVPNNVHDILTGTQANGNLDPNLTCADWTSNVAAADNLVRVGHSNRQGGGQAPSWSTTHTVGCSQSGTPNITQGGGRGSIYCFAVITGQ